MRGVWAYWFHRTCLCRHQKTCKTGILRNFRGVYRYHRDLYADSTFLSSAAGCRLVMAQQQEQSLPSAALPVHTELGFPYLQQLPSVTAPAFSTIIGWDFTEPDVREFPFKEKLSGPFMVL